MNATAVYARARSGFDERVDVALYCLRGVAAAHPASSVLATCQEAEDMVLTRADAGVEQRPQLGALIVLNPSMHRNIGALPVQSTGDVA